MRGDPPEEARWEGSAAGQGAAPCGQPGLTASTDCLCRPVSSSVLGQTFALGVCVAEQEGCHGGGSCIEQLGGLGRLGEPVLCQETWLLSGLRQSEWAEAPCWS